MQLFHISKKNHFHGLSSLPLDGVVHDADGCCIVTVDWYFWLWMAEVLKVELKFIPSWQLRNNAPSLASMADATKNHEIEHSVWKAPLRLMDFPLIGKDPMKKWPHALLWAFGLLKYDVLEWMFITIFDAPNRTVVLWCIAK